MVLAVILETAQVGRVPALGIRGPVQAGLDAATGRGRQLDHGVRAGWNQYRELGRVFYAAFLIRSKTILFSCDSKDSNLVPTMNSYRY